MTLRQTSWRRTSRDPQAIRFWGSAFLVTGLAVPLFLLSGHPPSLEGCDESFYAQMAREILQTGKWVAPTFLGEVFFEKPPLLPWLVAFAYQVAGIHEWSARLPGILTALAAIPLTGWIGRPFVGERAALIGMMVLPLCFLWVQQGRLVGQDVPLTFLELLGIAALVAGWRGSKSWFWLTGLAFGLGLLMKSAMVLLAGAATLPFLLSQWRRWLTAWSFWWGLLAGLGGFGVWLGLAIQQYGWRVVETLVGKVEDLGATPFHASNNQFYYFWHIPAHGFPWTVLALVGFWHLIRQQPSRTLLIWSFPLVLFLLLTIYPTRTHYYSVQLYPWLALLSGVCLDQALNWRQSPRLSQGISWGLGLLGVLLGGLGVVVIMGIPGLEMLQPHGLALLVIGFFYSSLPVIWLWRRALRFAGVLWLGSLLLASGVTLLSVVQRPDFGNFSPDMATFARSSPLLPKQVVIDIGRSGLADVCQAQAQAFYTPQPGRWVDDSALQAGDFTADYLWVSPVQWQQFSDRLGYLQEIAEVNGWRLMQRGSRTDILAPLDGLSR
ncbi:MAG: glycosyltransferase family 39 protein [Cyanobacteriota bacterium]|nr:glycosyltransferase family 39 protein [Cyanobacteriota bacterium]